MEEKLKIQLENWTYGDVNISVAWHDQPLRIRTPEDDLLDATQKAMQEQEWGVGCKTTSVSYTHLTLPTKA